MHSQQQQQQQPPQSLLQSQHHNHHHSHHHHPHNHHHQQQQPQQQQQQQQHHPHHHQQQPQQQQQHQHQHHHHHQQQHHHQPQQQQQPPLPPQQHQQQHQQHPHGPHSEQPNYHTQSHHPSHIHPFHGQHHVNHSQQNHPQHRHQNQQHQQHHHNHQLQQHHHIAPHGIPSMVQYQSNLMYQPHMGHHAFPPTGHIQQPSFNHASAQNHRLDHINVNPQSQAQPPAQPQTQTQAQSQTQTQPQPQAQPQTQTQPQTQPQSQSQQQHPPIQQQPPLAQPQQSQVPPGGMNPNNMPHLSQMSAPIMPSPNVGGTGVHPMGNGPMIDTHMQNRIPMQQWQFMPPPFNVPPQHMLHHYPHIHQNYHGAHITTPNPAMMTTRMQLEMGVRPPYELHNPTVPIATKVPISQAASIPAAKPPVGTIPTVAAAAAQQMAPTVAPTRERRRLAIVDPKTRRELTDDELKGSEKSQSSTSTTDSAPTPSTSATTVTTSTVTITTSTTTAKPSTVESAQTTVLKEVDVAPTNQTTVPEVISNNSRQATLPPIPETSVQTSSPGDQAPVTNRNVSPPDSSISSSNSPVLDIKSVAANEQSTTSNAIEKTASTIMDGMQALSISASSNGAPTIVSKPEVKANLDEVKTLNSDEIDHAISRSDDGDATNHDSKLEGDKEKNNVGAGQAETPNRELPNLPYSKGQYSPLNPTGHRRYTIEFLKAIGRLVLPEEPFRDPLAPRFMPPLDMPNRDNHGMSRRASQQTLNSKQPVRKIIATQSLQTEMEIKTAEKPWKPELETEKTKAIESGEIDNQRLLKLFRGLLNKITPHKYESIIEKIEALDLGGDDRLKSVIDLVFDKAVDEPGFCELYARMSKVIASRDSKFNHHLLKKCQDEFETSDLYSGLNVEGREQDIENESDAAKKKLLSEELYEDMRLRRKKYLGTIKLIGEMYKLGLLVPKIIGFCITRLLEDLSNENLECLCSLIATVGAKMAKEEDNIIKASIKNTLNVLNDIANNKRTSELFTLESRIRFKILDTIELSKRNWVPRTMVENNPKKISEIHEDSNKSRMQNFPRNNLKNNDVYAPQRRIQNQSSTRR